MRFRGLAAVLALVLLASCGDGGGGDGGASPDAPAAPAPPTELVDGPVTLVALGDSLTEGVGDEEGAGGYPTRLAGLVDSAGRTGSTAVNLGRSGWDSRAMVEGIDGEPGQLQPAVEAVAAAVAEGQAVIATVLIGSNDMWFVYAYGPPEGSTVADEDALVEVYRERLDLTVTELQDAGAIVVLGLPDEQTQRPGVADLAVLQSYFDTITQEEVEQMADLAGRLGEVVEAVATEHDALTVDTNGQFWADPSTMDPDGIHPNAAGYALLADLFFEVIEPLL